MGVIYGKDKLYWKTGLDNSGLKEGAIQAKGLLAGLSSQAMLVGGSILALVASFHIFKQGVAGVIRVGGTFSATMSNLLAVSRASVEAFKLLREDALRLGATTSKTASQVGLLQVAYAKLGYSAKEIHEATDATIYLSEALDADLTEAATVAGSAVRGFGYAATETQRVVDVMAASSTRSALDIEKLRESYKGSIPVANAFGLNIEQLTSMLAKLADRGLHGSIAGMALKNILGQLKDGSSSLAQVLGGTADTWEEFIDLLKKAKERGQAFKDAALANLDQRIKAVVINLVEASGELENFEQLMYNANGESERMAKTRLDNFTGDVKLLKSAMEGLGITLFDRVEPALRSIIQLATKLTTAIDKAFQTPDHLDELTRSINDQKVEFLTLIGVFNELRDKQSLTEQETGLLNRTISTLNENYSVYLGNIDLEKATREELNTAIRNTTEALIEEATTRYVLEQQSQLVKEIASLNYKDTELLVKKKRLEAEINEEKSRQKEKYEALEREVLELESRIDTLNDAEKIGLRMKRERLEAIQREEFQNEALISLNSKLKNTEREINELIEERAVKEGQLADHRRTFADIFHQIEDNPPNVTPTVDKDKLREEMEIAINEIKSYLSTYWDFTPPDFPDLFEDPDIEIADKLIPTEDQRSQIEKWWGENVPDLLRKTGDLVKDALADQLAEAFIEGKFRAEEFFNYLLKQLIKMAMMKFVLNPLFGFLGFGTSTGTPAAHGLDFVVPPGYPNDSFYLPLNVTSEERVIVIPKDERPRFDSLSGINGSLENLARAANFQDRFRLPPAVNTNPVINMNPQLVNNVDMSGIQQEISGMKTALQNMNIRMILNNREAGRLVKQGQNHLNKVSGK